MGTVSYHLDIPIYQETLRDHILERVRDAPRKLEGTEYGGMDNEQLRAYITERCSEFDFTDVQRAGFLQLAWATDEVVTTVG